MKWQEVCEHPSLQNLPFKIELDASGKVIMTPVKVYHAAYQAKISYLFQTLAKHGKAMVECAIHTRSGTKVADVAWASEERFETIKHEAECSIAPEICVEVLSEGNTDEEIEEKKRLYYEKGAQEVWICDRQGSISFHHPDGPLPKSLLIAAFPDKIEL